MRGLEASVLLSLMLLLIPDSAHPQNIKISLGTSYLWGAESTVAANSDYIVVGYPQGLRVFVNSSERDFAFLGSIEIPDGVGEVQLHDSAAYVVTMKKRLSVIDLSEPSNPIDRGIFGRAEPAHSLTTVDGYLVAFDWDHLDLYELSDPFAPSLVDECDCGSAAFWLASKDSLLLMVDRDNLIHAIIHRDGELIGPISINSTLGDRPASPIAVYGD